jgi:hypothetical protein
MTDDDEIHSTLGRSLQDLTSRMADEDVCLKLHIALLCLTLQVCEQLFVMARRQFDGRLCFDLGRRLGWGGHGDDGKPGARQCGQVQGIVERGVRVTGPVVTYQNVRGNHHPSGSPITTACGNVPAGEGDSALGKRYRGTKNAFATNVGTTALPITAAIKYEYCA